MPVVAVALVLRLHLPHTTEAALVALAMCVVRALWPRVAARLLKPVGFIGNVLLPLAVVALVAGALSAIWAAVGNGTVLAIVIFTVAGLAIGHALGGPKRDDSVVLAFSTVCRHPALALSIGSA